MPFIGDAKQQTPKIPSKGSGVPSATPSFKQTYTLSYGGQKYNLSQGQIDWMRDRYQKSFADTYKATSADTERYISGSMPSTYEKSYTKSNLDQKLLSMGLPSTKYLGKFMQEYDTWYGDGTQYQFDNKQSSYLSKEYQKTWQYSLTSEDQARQKAGKMPVALEKAYGDNYTDYTLMQQGLPPSSKLGDYVSAYNTLVGQQNRISQFYSTLANNVYGLSIKGIENNSTARDVPILNTTDKGAVGIGVPTSEKPNGIKDIGTGINPTKSVAGSTDWENAYYDLLLSPEWADIRSLHKDSQSNIDSTKYDSNEKYREAQVKLALKTDESDDSPFISYDDFLDFYNVRGGKKAIAQTAIVDKALNEYGIDTYGDLSNAAEKQRSAQKYATIDSRSTARAFANEVINTDPSYNASEILQEMYDNGVSMAQINQAKNVFVSKAKDQTEKDSINAKATSLQQLYDDQNQGKSQASTGALTFTEAATLMFGTDSEKSQMVSDFAKQNKQNMDAAKENARIDKLVKEGIVGAYNKSLFTTISLESAVKTADKYIAYDGETPDSSSLDAARKALSADGLNASEIEATIYESVTNHSGPTLWQRVGEIAPTVMKIGTGDVVTMVNETIKAWYAIKNALTKPDASKLEIKEMFDDLRSRGAIDGFALDNAIRRAGYSYMLDPVESAKNYYLSVESVQAGISPEKAIEQWDSLDDNGKKLYAENFQNNSMSNPLVHKTVEDVLLNQGVSAILPKVLASVADAGVGIAGLIINDPNKDAQWVKDASIWISSMRNYGSSNQSIFTQGVSVASDAGAELALMYGLNAAGGAIMSGTKIGAKLATAAATEGASFLTKAAASTLQSTPFLARSFGTYYTQAIQQGAPVGQAKLYALVAGGFEGWLESWTLDKTWGRLFGSENLAKAIKAGGDQALTSGMKASAKLMSLSAAFFGEASEEAISYATSWGLSALQGWNKDKFSFTEMGNQALMGGIIGMLGGAITSPDMSARRILADYMIASGEYKTSNYDLLLSSVLASGVKDDAKSQYIAQGYNAIMDVKTYAENQQALTDGRRQLIQGKSEFDLESKRMESRFKDTYARAVSAESLVAQIKQTENAESPSEEYIRALENSAKIGASEQIKQDYQTSLKKLTDAYNNTTDQQNRSIEKAKAKQAAHHVVLTDFFSPEIKMLQQLAVENAVNRAAFNAQFSSDKSINLAFDVGNLDTAALDAYDSAVKARGNAFAAAEAAGSAFSRPAIQSAIDAKMEAMRAGNAKEYIETERAKIDESKTVVTKEKAIIDTVISRAKKYSSDVAEMISMQFPESTNPRGLDNLHKTISDIATDILTGGSTYLDEYTLLQTINDAVNSVEVDFSHRKEGTNALYGHDVSRILDKISNTKFYQDKHDTKTNTTTRIFTDEELAKTRGNIAFTKSARNGQDFQSFYDSLARDYPLQFPKASGMSALSILNDFVSKTKSPKYIPLGSISNGDISFDMSEMIASDLMDDLSDSITQLESINERGNQNAEGQANSAAEPASQEVGGGKTENAAAVVGSQPAEKSTVDANYVDYQQNSTPRVQLTNAEMDEVSKLGELYGKPVQFADLGENEDGRFGPDGIVINTRQFQSEGSSMQSVVNSVYTHELLHSLKGSKQYNAYADFVVASAVKATGRPASELYQVIQSHRKDVTGRDITAAEARDELIATFTAEKLPNNQQFATSLVNEQNGAAGRILNWIHYSMRLVKAKLSTDSTAMSTLVKMERMFTKAFAASDGSATEDIRHSISGSNQSDQNSEPVQQGIPSDKTSRKQIPALFKNKNVKFGQYNIDIGGGKFDLATNYLASAGTNNLVFDPYNRSSEENTNTLSYLQSGNRAETATVANVLNVIAEPEARNNVILQAAKSISPDGRAYFTVYEGDESGIGKETKDGWQNNRATSSYVDEIGQYFNKVTRNWKLITASDPKPDLPAAAWEIQLGNATRYSVSGRGLTTLSDLVQKYGAIEPGKEPIDGSVSVPRRGGNGERVSYTARTAIESPNVLPSVKETIMRGIETGDLGTYKSRSNDETMTKANALIAEFGGPESAAKSFITMAKRGTIQQKDSAVMDAMAMQLAANATMRNDPATALDLVSALILTGTPAGQTVQIRNLFKDLKGVGQAYYTEKWIEKYNDDYADEISAGKRQAIVADPALMEDLTAAQTPKQIDAALDAVYRNIGPQVPMNILERLEQWRYFSMLANPVTHVRNFTSTAMITGAMRPAANAVASKIEESWVKRGKMQQSDRLHAAVSQKSNPAEYQFADAMWDKYKTSVMAGGKYNIDSEIHQYQNWSKIKSVDSAEKFTSMALETEDAFWMRRAFKDEFVQYMVAQGISPDNMTSDQERVASQHAADQARHAAFRDASSAAKALTNLSNNYKRNPTAWNYFVHGVIEGGMPFKKTPVNVVKVGLEYSPVGLIRGIYDAANGVKNGTIEPTVAIDRISRGVVGSGLTIVGALARALGVLRGSGEEDKKYDKYMTDKGEQKFSVSFGDTSISLAAISPATMPIFLGAALYDLASSENTGAEPRDILGQIGKSVAGIADPIMELSFMSSLNQIIQTFGSEDAVGGSLGSIIAEALGSYAAQFVPTVGGKLSQMTGEYYRSTIGDATSALGPGPDSWLRKQVKKIPGLSTTLEPSTSLFGEKKERPVLFEGDSFGLWALDFANSFILPGNIKIKDRDAVDEELIRVYESTGDSGILPTYRQSKYFTVGGKDYYMNAKQYTQYSVERGQSVYAALKSAMLSDAYQSADYQQRSDILSSAVSKAQESVDDRWKVTLYDLKN